MTQHLPSSAVFIAASSKSLINFRYDLMIAVQQQRQYKVYALAPQDQDYPHVQAILAQAQIKLIPFGLNNTGLNIFKDLFRLFQLYELLNKLKPCLIVVAAIKPIICGLLIGCLLRIPNKIVLMTGLGHLYTGQDMITKILRFISSILYRITLPLADHIFFQNKDDQQLFCDLNLIRNEQSTLTPGSGVNLSQFLYTPLPPYQTIKFLFIGRLLQAKGIEEFCRAAGHIKARHSHTVFQVLGGFHSNPNSATHRHLHQLFIENGIDYLGEQPSTLPYLQAAHVVVLPSYYREGIPKSLLEALAVGRAIITTDSPGCRETVIEGENGYLIKPRDVLCLTQAITKLIENPHSLEEMGQNSYALAVQKFDVKLVNDLVLNHIK